MRSFKTVTRSLIAVLMIVGISSAQLMNGKSFDVIRVEKTGISAGHIDSLAQLLGTQQFPGKKLTDDILTQLRYAVVDNLVGQELVKLEAKKQGVKVPAARIDSAVTLFKKQFPSEDMFQKELKKSNLTMAQFKKKIEEQLQSEVVLKKAVAYPKDPTEDERKAYWTLHKSEAEAAKNDSISGIRIFLSTKGKSAQEIADMKTLLNAIPAQIRSMKLPYYYAIQAFAKQAAQSSQDPNAKKTGGVIRTTPKAGGASFEKAVAKLKVGDISEVYNDKDGISIFMLVERNDGKYESFKYQIDNVLKMQAEQKYQMQLKAYLNGLGKVYKVQYLDKKYTPPEAIGAI